MLSSVSRSTSFFSLPIVFFRDPALRHRLRHCLHCDVIKKHGCGPRKNVSQRGFRPSPALRISEVGTSDYTFYAYRCVCVCVCVCVCMCVGVSARERILGNRNQSVYFIILTFIFYGKIKICLFGI